MGGTLGLLRKPWGGSVGWAGATAQVADHPWQWWGRQVEEPRMVWSTPGVHAAAGAPRTRQLGPRGAWEDRRLVAPVRALLTRGCHLQQVRQRGGAAVPARLAFTRAACTVLVQWHGCQPDAAGFVPLSSAEFSL